MIQNYTGPLQPTQCLINEKSQRTKLKRTHTQKKKNIDLKNKVETDENKGF